MGDAPGTRCRTPFVLVPLVGVRVHVEEVMAERGCLLCDNDELLFVFLILFLFGLEKLKEKH